MQRKIMGLFVKRLGRFCCFCCCCCFYPVVFASDSGELAVFVFYDGLPENNFEVVIDGKSKAASNSDGSIFRKLKEGKHFLEIKRGQTEESIPFYIAKDESTRIYINLFSRQKDLRVELSQPEVKAISLPGGQAGMGVLSGKVENLEGLGVRGVQIFLSGIEEKVVSDEKGKFSLSVPAGNYTLAFFHPDFSTKSVPGVTVGASQKTSKNIRLSPAGLELEEFTVLAPHIKGSLAALIEIRQKSTQVADVLGSEQISKAGDSDAASSLRRVTSLSIIGGKYVYIRGLGERYSSVLLNNLELPSPDPTRRVVQLDLFPASVLQDLIVQKSYSPDLPGNFGGGTVILRTKGRPEKFTSKLSLSLTSPTNRREMKTYRGGKRDWLGMDDGTRALPDSIERATANGRRLSLHSQVNPEGHSLKELRQFSKDMPRHYNLQGKQSQVIPSLNFSLGDLYKHKGVKIGYLFSSLYSNQWDDEEKVKFSYKSDGAEDYQRASQTYRQTVKLSSMLNAELDWGNKARLTSNTILLRKSTDKLKEDVKSSKDDSDANYRSVDMEWQERQLFSQSLLARLNLFSRKDFFIEAKGAISEARRYQPDSRSYQQDLKENTYITSTEGKRNQKLYNDLIDDSHSYVLQSNFPLGSGNWWNASGKLGWGLSIRDRESKTQRFKYGQVDAELVERITGNPNILQESLEEICSDQVIDGGGCLLEDITDASDRYSAWQRVRSYFVDGELKLFKRLRFNLGVRFEESEQVIINYHGVDWQEKKAGMVMQDFLPAARATWFLSDTLQWRLTYGETVSRPDFKDLNQGSYYDDEKGRFISGTLNLKGSIIKSIDSRIEWYFSNQENISLGFFRKKFSNPIEEIAGSFNNQGELVFAESKYQLANVGDAEVTGMEIEMRKDFSFISPRWAPLSIGGNYSYMDSQVDIFPHLADQVTNQTRAMQGQSPFVLNLNLDYDNADLGTNATLLFNIFGERIDSVGLKPFGDVMEQPFRQVDFVFSQKFGKGNKIRFKLKNLLNPPLLKTEDGRVKETYRKGRFASLAYTRNF